MSTLGDLNLSSLEKANIALDGELLIVERSFCNCDTEFFPDISQYRFHPVSILTIFILQNTLS